MGTQGWRAIRGAPLQNGWRGHVSVHQQSLTTSRRCSSHPTQPPFQRVCSVAFSAFILPHHRPHGWLRAFHPAQEKPVPISSHAPPPSPAEHRPLSGSRSGLRRMFPTDRLARHVALCPAPWPARVPCSPAAAHVRASLLSRHGAPRTCLSIPQQVDVCAVSTFWLL